MLYILLKPLMRLAIWLYFGKVRREGLEHIDNGKPVLIVANHTASFMDAMITAVYVKRRIWFFTRGDVFRFKWIAWILRSLGMLPVYRMRDGKERLQENEASNDAALDILGSGGAVLIFAEGESAVDKILKPLKKGPFRLAIRAADLLQTAPIIVPLGINYVLPAAPFGEAWLVAGAPYPIPKGDSATATRRATELMRQSASELAALCWHIDFPLLRPAGQFMLERFDDICPNPSFSDTLQLTSTFNNLNYRSADALLKDWEEFRIWQRLQPTPGNLFIRPAKPVELLVAVLGAPLAAAGWLLHAIPLSFATTLTRRKVREADFITPVYLCLAVVFTMLWYAGVVTLCLLEARPDRLWIPLVLMPAAGIFLLKAWLPAFRHASSPLVRKLYRRRNPSHQLVFRLYEVLLQIGWMMVGRADNDPKRNEQKSELSGDSLI